ncbi:MAG: hypothetical protein WBA74_19780 [Cyclobacteriaceae bacterium]
MSTPQIVTSSSVRAYINSKENTLQSDLISDNGIDVVFRSIYDKNLNVHNKLLFTYLLKNASDKIVQQGITDTT